MKPTSKLTIFVFTLLALTASAYSESPREQFQTAAAAKKAEKEKAGVKTAADKRAATIMAQARRLEGDWYLDVTKNDRSRSGIKYLQTLSIKRDARGVWRVKFLTTGDSKVVGDFHPYDIEAGGAELRFSYDHTLQHPDHIEVTANIRATATVESDGRTLKLVTEPLPFTGSQIAYQKNWSKYTPQRKVDVYEKQ